MRKSFIGAALMTAAIVLTLRAQQPAPAPQRGQAAPAAAPQRGAPAPVAQAQTYQLAPPARLYGHPNFNGIWQVMNTANWNLEAHNAEALSDFWKLGAIAAVPAGRSVVRGGTIPYLPEALKKRNENRANRLKLDPEVKCYLPGVPRASYMGFPFQIIQSQKHVMLVHEYAGAVRTIYMADQTEAPAHSWMGWSNGRWEGESLVVDTKGFNDLSWFDRSGNFHSDALHVVERFTARSADTLNYEVTVEDPKVFTRPWKMSMPLYRRVETNAQILEFRCVEFVEDLLYGHLRKQPSQ